MIALLTAALTLAVPFLPQTEALCGGAAAAMVFRYWGDRHADVQQFASLVDRHAGGIADSTLIDAIRARGWNAQRLDGSLATIRDQLDAGRPLILLIEDRPLRYHYIVAVGRDEEHVFVHDPTWGPARRLSVSELLRRWKPTGFWTLLVTPGQGTQMASAHASAGAAKSVPSRKTSPTTMCDRLLDEALDTIDVNGLSAADQALQTVIQHCPTAGAPLGELAGVRFAQHRWRDAADLAHQALVRDPEDAYAWDVLGSSRFVQDEAESALQAWNHIDKPTLDLVQIGGLSRTRYALVAQLAGVTPNTLLTAQQLSLATRRLGELPDRVTTSVSYRPGDDGFATLNVNIVERSRGPRTIADWLALGAQAGIDREITVALPGATGQGEVWDASWRWWNGRPRIAVGFTAPRAGRFGGIWRVEGSWEAQTYGLAPQTVDSTDIRQNQSHGAISYTNWLMPNLHFETASGVDVWNESGVATRSDEVAADPIQNLRTVFFSASVDRRFASDRVEMSGRATSWSPIGGGHSFRSASIRGLARSSVEPTTFTAVAEVSADFATAQAPLAIWPGAGDGFGRPALLRAHPLLDDGVITGPAFGRQLQSATFEVQRWFERWQIPRVGIAVFADSAHASDRLDGAAGRLLQVDIGTGLRVRMPGSDRSLRFDYAHGLRDRHASAISVGIVTPLK